MVDFCGEFGTSCFLFFIFVFYYFEKQEDQVRFPVPEFSKFPRGTSEPGIERLSKILFPFIAPIFSLSVTSLEP